MTRSHRRKDPKLPVVDRCDITDPATEPFPVEKDEVEVATAGRLCIEGNSHHVWACSSKSPTCERNKRLNAQDEALSPVVENRVSEIKSSSYVIGITGLDAVRVNSLRDPEGSKHNQEGFIP